MGRAMESKPSDQEISELTLEQLSRESQHLRERINRFRQSLGRYFVESLLSRDYPMIMAVILLYGVFLSVMNLIVDVLYGVVDPRIHY